MSLMSADTSANEGRFHVKVMLRTADQYPLWKARINSACWSATRISVFAVSDEDCSKASANFANGYEKRDWVGKCWIIVTSALHDELFLKLAHVEQGHIATLMSEIRAALLVNIAEDIQPLRLELYAASMLANGCDLQSYISFIVQRRQAHLPWC